MPGGFHSSGHFPEGAWKFEMGERTKKAEKVLEAFSHMAKMLKYTTDCPL